MKPVSSVMWKTAYVKEIHGNCLVIQNDNFPDSITAHQFCLRTIDGYFQMG